MWTRSRQKKSCLLITWLMVSVLFIGGNTFSTGPSDPNSISIDVLVFVGAKSCSGDDAVNNIIAESDDLPISFQIVQNESVLISSDESAIALANQRAVHGVIWFSCETPRLHMVTPLDKALVQHRLSEQNDDGLNIEAASAVVRSWLEAVYEISLTRLPEETAPAKEPNAPNTSNDSLANEDGLLLDAKVSNKKNTEEIMRFVELGSNNTMASRGEILPGAYIQFATQMRGPLFLLAQFGMYRTLSVNNGYVVLEIKKHPLSIGAQLLFQRNRSSFSLVLAAEVDVLKRIVSFENGSGNDRYVAQMGIVAAMEISWRLFRSVSVVVRGGARILFARFAFETTINDERQVIHDPIPIQPLAIIGLRVVFL